jgi:phosphatidylglycerophosphate synthase
MPPNTPHSPADGIPRPFRASGLVWQIGIDLLVILSPVMVILLFSVRHHIYEGVLTHEEWLFVSIILYADSIIRLLRATMAPGKRKRPAMLFLTVALLFLGFFGCSLYMADAMFADVLGKTSNCTDCLKASGLDVSREPNFHSQWMQWVYLFFSVAAFAWCSGIEYVSERRGETE